MQIVYNSPDHKEQRVNVKPLSLKEMQKFIFDINRHEHYLSRNIIEGMQRLIFDYENLSHMRETQPKWIDAQINLPEQYEDVLCVDNAGDMYIDFIYSANHWSDFPISPKYWQKLPESPIK